MVSSRSRERWVDIWACMPQYTEADYLPPAPYTSENDVFDNTTIRQTVKVSLRTDTLRLRVSNELGETPLSISRVTVAKPAMGRQGCGSSSVNTGSIRDVSFSGREKITVPASALCLSDPVRLEVYEGDIITISIYLAFGQASHAITSHPGSRTTSWLAKGDQTGQTDLIGEDVTAVDHWYLISALEGRCESGQSLVLIGDSITDGRGSTTNGNDRWPNKLWERLQRLAATATISPINLAAGGNQILIDGLGPNAWSRVGRDVLSHPNVGYAMIFEGVNDIGTAEPTQEAQDEVYNRLTAAYAQMVSQIHAHGIPVFGATITPFGSQINEVQSYSHPIRDRTRRRINEWIRLEGPFDYVVDFAAAVCDPQKPDRLLAEYDSGDLLHLNPTGFERLADVFDMTVFERFSKAEAYAT